MTLKGHDENLILGQGHDLARKSNVAYQSMRILGLNTSKYCLFIALACLYQKLLQKNCRRPFMHGRRKRGDGGTRPPQSK